MRTNIRADGKQKLASFHRLECWTETIDEAKLYSYARFLASKLPPRATGEKYIFDDEVSLKFFRLQMISEGAIKLGEGDNVPVTGPTAVGTGKAEDIRVELSRLIDLVNERFGTDFTQADELFFHQLREETFTDDVARVVSYCEQQGARHADRRHDLAVMDRYYCSFMMIALLLPQRTHTCARKHHLRHADFRRGKRLGKYDHLIVWTRPQRPQWRDEDTYAEIPEQLMLR